MIIWKTVTWKVYSCGTWTAFKQRRPWFTINVSNWLISAVIIACGLYCILR